MIGSSLVLSNSLSFAEAQAPALKMSGFTSIIALCGDQSVKSNGKGGTDPSFAVGASDFRLTVGGKSAGDFGYKYVINFKTIPGQDPLVNRNYVEFDSNDIGSIQIGVVKGVDDSMTVDTYGIMGGTGGVDNGSAFNLINEAEGVINGVTLIGSTDTATKINWFSPTVAIGENLGSLQIGLSYTPNTSHNGKGARDNSQSGKSKFGNETNIYSKDGIVSPFGLKNVVYGITYKNTFGGYALTLSAIGVSEHSRAVVTNKSTGAKRTIALQRTGSYQLSAMLSAGQWDYTAAWLDNKKSRLNASDITTSPDNKIVSVSSLLSQNANLGNSGTAWNVGTRYSFGAYQAAVGYFRTDRKTDATQKATMDAICTTLDFKALEGLKFFGEVNYIRTKTNKSQLAAAQTFYENIAQGQQAIGNNAGTVLILGTKVSF